MNEQHEPPPLLPVETFIVRAELPTGLETVRRQRRTTMTAEWKLKRGDEEYVVPNVAKLREWAVEGRVLKDDYVFNPVLGRWMYARELGELAATATFKPKKQKSAIVESHRVGSREETRGSVVACVILGVFFLVVGLYFLLNPSNAGSDVANVHRLTLGETFSIMGAIFLAAGIRPRELLIDVWDSPKTAPAVTRSRPGTGVLCPVCYFVFDGEYGTEGWWCPTCGAARH